MEANIDSDMNIKTLTTTMERQQQQHQPQTPLSQAQTFGRPHCAASDAYPELP